MNGAGWQSRPHPLAPGGQAKVNLPEPQFSHLQKVGKRTYFAMVRQRVNSTSRLHLILFNRRKFCIVLDTCPALRKLQHGDTFSWYLLVI